jgi:hypothetical protein
MIKFGKPLPESEGAEQRVGCDQQHQPQLLRAAAKGGILHLLLRPEVVEVGVVDHIQPAVQLLRILVVALRLLPKLSRIYTLPNIEIQEAFLKLREQAKCHYQNPKELLNFNVRKGIDTAELVDADLWHLVLSSYMGESVDAHQRHLPQSFASADE